MNVSEERHTRDLAQQLAESNATIDALLSGQIDAVVDASNGTTVQMPEMDGVECTAMIRDKEQVTRVHLPIVAMTAHAMSGDEARRRAAGMDAYLSNVRRP